MSKLVSMRIDDDVVEIINSFHGKNFTDKFQNLVRFYSEQLPTAQARYQCSKERTAKEYKKLEEYTAVSKYLSKLNIELGLFLTELEELQAGINP